MNYSLRGTLICLYIYFDTNFSKWSCLWWKTNDKTLASGLNGKCNSIHTALQAFSMIALYNDFYFFHLTTYIAFLLYRENKIMNISYFNSKMGPHISPIEYISVCLQIKCYDSAIISRCENLSVFVGYKSNSWIFMVHVTAFGNSVYGLKY